MIGLVVKMSVHLDQIEAYETAMKDMMAKVKANEPGCSFYQLFKSPETPGAYVVMEQYASREALDAHNKTPYMAEIVGLLQPCLAAAPDIQEFEMVE